MATEYGMGNLQEWVMGSDKHSNVDASMLQICMSVSVVPGSDKGKLDASVLQICIFVDATCSFDINECVCDTPPNQCSRLCHARWPYSL